MKRCVYYGKQTKNALHKEIFASYPTTTSIRPDIMPSHEAIQAANNRLARLMSIIQAPKISFSQERPMHKEVWNSEVTNDEWRAALYQAHGLATDALKEYVTALETEALQMRAVLTASGSLRLLPAQLGNAEAMKGDICVQVQQRWAYEEMTQLVSGMSGR